MIRECLIVLLEQFLSDVLSDVAFLFSIFLYPFSSSAIFQRNLPAQSSSHPSHPSFLNKRRKVPRTPVPVPRPVQALAGIQPRAHPLQLVEMACISLVSDP